MPTVIDSLVVTVGLDSSGLKKGQQDVKKETKQTEATLVREAKKTEAANEKIRKQKAAAEAKAQKQKEATAKKTEATLAQEAKKTEAANEKIRKQKAAAEVKAQKQKEATTKKTEATLVQEANKTEAANEKIRKQKAAAEVKAQKQKEATAKKAAEETRRKNKLAEADAKKSRDNIASTFKETLGAFGIALGLKELIGFLIDLNQSTRQLGLDSKNFGQASEELRNWQNAAVAAGGTAEDATNAVAGFQQAIFNLRTQGNVSPQLLMQWRIGLDIRDAAAKGELKELDQFALEAATAIEKQHVSRAQAFQLANAIGLPGGLANVVAEGRKVTEDFLAEQKRISQITAKDVAITQQAARDVIVTKQHVIGGATKILTSAETAIYDVKDAKGFKAKAKALGGIAEDLTPTGAIKAVGRALYGDEAEPATDTPKASTPASIFTPQPTSSLFAPNPNAIQFNQGVGPTPGASSIFNNSSAQNTKSVDNSVNVDNVNVFSNATHLDGILQDTRDASRRKNIVGPADSSAR